MTKIGYLIPEFPGQTHAFFMRERDELTKLGVETDIISTKPPLSGRASHTWAQSAAAETTYLYPLTVGYVWSIAIELLRAGPLGWLRCLVTLLTARGLSLGERMKLMLFIPSGALLLSFARKHVWQHVHVHSCANAANVAMFAQRLGGISYSLTLHGRLSDYGPNQNTKWRFAKFVVVITKALTAEALANLDRSLLPRLMLAPMGVDVDRFRRAAPYVAATRQDRVRLVACGRINPCKGHDDLIRAVAELERRGIIAELSICGATDSQRVDYRDQLEALIQENNLVDRVKLLGSVSEERVRDELQDAHFFCLGSHHEALGVATVEAMAMEVPCVVTNHPGVAEMITDGKDGKLVPVKNPLAVADAIEQLIDDPEYAVAVGQRARATIVERFHSGVSAEAILCGVTGRPDPVAQSASSEQPEPELIGAAT